MKLSNVGALQLGVTFLLGAALTFEAQAFLPFIGRELLERDFRAAYVDCALSEQHAAHFVAVKLSPLLRKQLDKTLTVEDFRCLDYAQLKLRLQGFHVSDVQIALIELDALAKAPTLQCDRRCRATR